MIVCVRFYIFYYSHNARLDARIVSIPLFALFILILKDALGLEKDVLYVLYIIIPIIVVYVVKGIIDVIRGHRLPDNKISSTERNKRFIDILVIYLITTILVKLLGIE